MHSNPLEPLEKNCFVEKHKKCAICAILREKNPFLGHTQRLKNAPYVRSLGKKSPIMAHTQRVKNVLHVVRCAKHAPQRPKNNANPSGLLEKMFIVYEVCYFVGKVVNKWLKKRLKNVLHVVKCAKHAPQRPKQNATPSELSEKNVHSVESLLFCR